MSDYDRARISIVPDVQAMSERAADIVAEALRIRPESTLTFPTGSTPLALFAVLAARNARQELDFSEAMFFSLDDYLGLNGHEPNSLTHWLQTSLLDHINLHPERTHLVPAGAPNPREAAEAYDRLIAEKGGLDLAILGIGANGHIAFNEPGSDPRTRTRIVRLTPETIAQATAYWQGAFPIPEQAMTVGIGNLLEARRIVLLASGRAKADALRRAFQEPPDLMVPASHLQRAGARLEIIADREAASLLQPDFAF